MFWSEGFTPTSVEILVRMTADSSKNNMYLDNYDYCRKKIYHKCLFIYTV